MASVDNGRLQSKLVMQTQGSLRLILSAKLWAQTQINKAKKGHQVSVLSRRRYCGERSGEEEIGFLFLFHSCIRQHTSPNSKALTVHEAQ
ncbi:Ran-binding protein 3 [Manis javanica]|nr:Ran-binding protein 3 [Manis javanica]